MKTVLTFLSSIIFAYPTFARSLERDGSPHVSEQISTHTQVSTQIDTTKPIKIPANCTYVGSRALSNGAISTGSARGTDKALEASNGIIELKMKAGKQDPEITIWTANQVINIGHDYSIAVNLVFQDGRRMGPVAYAGYTLYTNAILKYKNKPVSGASIRSERVESEYSDGSGDQFYQVEFELDNVLLREKLGLVDQLDADLIYALRDSPEKMKLFSSLGDGDGVVTSGIVHCTVPVLK